MPNTEFSSRTVLQTYRGWPISCDASNAVWWEHGGPFQTIKEACADIVLKGLESETGMARDDGPDRLKPTTVKEFRPDANQIEYAIADLVRDVQILTLISQEATDRGLTEKTGTGGVITFDQETFSIWKRACEHVEDAARDLSLAFFGEIV